MAKILQVTRDIDSASLRRVTLEAEGHEVFTAQGVGEAIQIFEREAVSCILLCTEFADAESTFRRVFGDARIIRVGASDLKLPETALNGTSSQPGSPSQGGSHGWKGAVEAALIESNIPRFRKKAAAALNHIANRKAELTHIGSPESLAERADLKLAEELLLDFLQSLPTFPDEP